MYINIKTVVMCIYLHTNRVYNRIQVTESFNGTDRETSVPVACAHVPSEESDWF